MTNIKLIAAVASASILAVSATAVYLTKRRAKKIAGYVSDTDAEVVQSVVAADPDNKDIQEVGAAAIDAMTENAHPAI